AQTRRRGELVAPCIAAGEPSDRRREFRRRRHEQVVSGDGHCIARAIARRVAAVAGVQIEADPAATDEHDDGGADRAHATILPLRQSRTSSQVSAQVFVAVSLQSVLAPPYSTTTSRAAS